MPDSDPSDWAEDVPVIEAEVDVFEAWFGDLLDELFSTKFALNGALTIGTLGE